MYRIADRDPRLEIAITRWLLDSEQEYRLALAIATTGDESSHERCEAAHRDLVAAFEASNVLDAWPTSQTPWA